MKIAVTGASGFLGHHVVREFAAREGLEIVATSRSDTRASLPKNVRHVKLDIATGSPDHYDALGRPDSVVHLAWSGLPNYKSLHHFETELPMQYAFLSSLIRAGLPSLLVTGTCYEYGMQCGELHESAAAAPANPYALAKDALRRQLEFLCAKEEARFVWSRLFYMYGCGQAASSLYAQLMLAIDRGDRSFKMSAGDQLRDYLPVEDVARLIVALAVEPSASGIFNVCSGKPVSIRAFVERLLAQRGATMQLDLSSLPYVDYEPMAFWGSRTRLDKVLAVHAQ